MWRRRWRAVWVTVWFPLFATHMLAPSKAIAIGWTPTGNVPRKTPSLARNSTTAFPIRSVIQILAHRRLSRVGLSQGRTLQSNSVAGAQLGDSDPPDDVCHPDVGAIERIANGSSPTRNVPRVVPSLARSLVTVPPPKFATQMLAPSKAVAIGFAPTENVPKVAHRWRATR